MSRMQFHPLTGERIEPIWVAPNGRVFWPILGGDDTVPPADPPADPPAQPAPPAAPPAPATPPATPPWGDDKNFDAAKAWKLIEGLRADKSNVDEKVKAATEAAEKSIVERLGKALGVMGEDKTPTAEELAEQVKKAQGTNSALQVENAVLRLAGPAGANAQALLDSRSFMDSIAKIDPSDSEAVKNAITQAVSSNKALAAQAGAFTGGMPGGFQEPATQRPKSLGEAISRHYTAQ
jgi:hypothetical protein